MNVPVGEGGSALTAGPAACPCTRPAGAVLVPEWPAPKPKPKPVEPPTATAPFQEALTTVTVCQDWTTVLPMPKQGSFVAE